MVNRLRKDSKQLLISLYVVDFLVSSGHDAAFEQLPVDELCQILRKFYGCVRQRPKGTETIGKEYSRSGYKNMRAGIQRYLASPPLSREVNIMSDVAFRPANLKSVGL